MNSNKPLFEKNQSEANRNDESVNSVPAFLKRKLESSQASLESYGSEIIPKSNRAFLKIIPYRAWSQKPSISEDSVDIYRFYFLLETMIGNQKGNSFKVGYCI